MGRPRIAGYNTREIACTAHVCLCPLVFVLAVDTDKNESCFWMCRITMCQRDYHRLLFTACWLWYPACAGVDAYLFPFITRAEFQPARSCSVGKLEAVVAQVELPPSNIAGHGLWAHQAGAALIASNPRLALGNLSQSIIFPRRGSVHVQFADDIVYVGKWRVQVSRL